MKPQAAVADDTGAGALTPCIGVCRLDERGLCLGCRRSMAEIAAWRELPDAERIRFMRDVLPARKPR